VSLYCALLSFLIALNHLGRDLRGYKKNQAQGLYLLSGEVELRHSFNKNWKGLLFGGVGNISDEYNEFINTTWSPAAGSGIRRKFAKFWKINLRLDIAVGKNGVFGYLGVGESF
jgi:outer membrane translocation and assembly module TamA